MALLKLYAAAARRTFTASPNTPLYKLRPKRKSDFMCAIVGSIPARLQKSLCFFLRVW